MTAYSQFERIWAMLLILWCLIVCWMGQVLVFVAPNVAMQFGLSEPADSVNPTLWADLQGEALTDALLVWTLGVAGLLLLLLPSRHHHLWPYWGLVGSGMYVYFGVRGILQRLFLQAHDISYGSPSYQAFAMAMCASWALTGLVTIGLAVSELEHRRTSTTNHQNYPYQSLP